MADIQEVVAALELELRRGITVMSVLSQLTQPRYGYALVQVLEEKEMGIEPGTLYPLLRRLEKQGLLKSEWETGGTKPRKYYVITEQGRAAYEMLQQRWKKLSAGMER